MLIFYSLVCFFHFVEYIQAVMNLESDVQMTVMNCMQEVLILIGNIVNIIWFLAFAHRARLRHNRAFDTSSLLFYFQLMELRENSRLSADEPDYAVSSIMGRIFSGFDFFDMILYLNIFFVSPYAWFEFTYEVSSWNPNYILECLKRRNFL